MIIIKKIHSILVSCLEWSFVCLMYLAFASLSYYCLFVIGSFYHQQYKSITIDVVLCLSMLWLLFNIVFNYVMVLTTSPGIALEKQIGFEKAIIV